MNVSNWHTSTANSAIYCCQAVNATTVSPSGIIRFLMLPTLFVVYALLALSFE